MLEQEVEAVAEGVVSLSHLQGLWLYGAQENSFFCGTDAQSLPTVRVQVG